MIPTLVSCGRAEGCLFGHGQHPGTSVLARRLSSVRKGVDLRLDLSNVTAARALVEGMAAVNAHTFV